MRAFTRISEVVVWDRINSIDGCWVEWNRYDHTQRRAVFGRYKIHWTQFPRWQDNHKGPDMVAKLKRHVNRKKA